MERNRWSGFLAHPQEHIIKTSFHKSFKTHGKGDGREIQHWRLPIEPRWLHKPSTFNFAKRKKKSSFVTQATHNHQNFSCMWQNQCCRGSRVNEANCFSTGVAGRGQRLLCFFSEPFSWDYVRLSWLEIKWCPAGRKSILGARGGKQGHCWLGSYNFPLGPCFHFPWKKELGF